MKLIKHKNKNYIKSETGYREVLATTDKLPYPLDDKRTIWNSFLPQIPQSFVKKYCEAGSIENVLIEYEEYLDLLISEHGCYIQRTKVNSHNEITIHPVKSAEKQSLDFLKEVHTEWSENWDMVIDFLGQDKADQWDKIVGYNPDE